MHERVCGVEGLSSLSSLSSSKPQAQAPSPKPQAPRPRLGEDTGEDSGGYR